MTVATVRLGLVGAGPWGHNIIRALREIPTVRLAWVATRQSEAVGRLLPAGCRIISDWHDVLAAGGIEGVLIAVTPKAHYEVASAALAAGLAVLIEKPVTLDPADASRLIEQARRANVVAQVNHLDLFNPAWQALRARLPQLGIIRRVEARFGADGPCRIDVTPRWDWAPHPIGLCLDLCGPPREVRVNGLAQSERQGLRETLDVSLVTNDGVVQRILTGNDFTRPERRIVVESDHCALRYDDKAEHKLTLIEGDRVAPLPVRDGKPLTLALQRFANAIAAGVASTEDLERGCAVVEVLARIDAQLPQARINAEIAG